MCLRVVWAAHREDRLPGHQLPLFLGQIRPETNRDVGGQQLRIVRAVDRHQVKAEVGKGPLESR